MEASVTATQDNDETNRKMKTPDENKFEIDEDDYRVLKAFIPRIRKEEVDVDEENRVIKLRVRGFFNLTYLPEEIENLARLETLNLQWSSIASLPSSIGRLQNLKCLNLSCTERLSNLPEEIGNLASLERLNLQDSHIASLPPSIGQLQNLKTLDLQGSHIKSLPPSIGRLQNLKCLDLSSTESLYNLPIEIGNLARLETLNLRESHILPLPLSIGRLQSLIKLDLSYSEGLFNTTELYWEKFVYTISLTAARKRIGFGNSNKDSIQTKLKLWPILLNNASSAFCINNVDFQHSGIGFKKFRIQKPDAIYTLLAEYREVFITCLLVNGNANR
jgi:hypothetical protein